MKKSAFLLLLSLALVAEIVVLVLFAVQTPDYSQDTVAVNEVVQSVTQDFATIERHHNRTALDYVVIAPDGTILYQTRSGLSTTVNAAIAHRDTILDIIIDNSTVAKVIIHNDGAQTLRSHQQTAIIVLSVAIGIQMALCIGYAVYMHYTIVRPFAHLKGFAERIAGGNLDIPLDMDKRNLFGAFTESFDIMRTELKRARIAEAQANTSKKELVAKLSHDIKTPVASIKAVAEVGLALTDAQKDKANYTQIVAKADQIDTLVTDLFTATLQELQQLTVTPTNLESTQIKLMLQKADYLHRATIPDIPACLVYADSLRLQQVFDNIFANAYKYADTAIVVTARQTDNHITVVIEDFGGGVSPEELPTLKEKFKRGTNAEGIEGAGLGLYIADHCMKEMHGDLAIQNGAHGLQVTVSILLSGKM